ncbi:unnamed protein product [Cylicocyclus nassatus]|uniref:Uncharacterized protein n=1 Tax=Cylicocyclus nassatus TaxID=53992 RepID=A0AA36MCX2_CYLNA|nr:unnamed protein product [Cylicocyclus nassatus]
MKVKPPRAPIMTNQELCMISEFYVRNYNVFHGALPGSSKQPTVKEKREKLEELSRNLVASGYPERTVNQLDQRIRDTLKNARKYAAFERSEHSETDGGVPTKLIPAHIDIILKELGDKLRVKASSTPSEFGGYEGEESVMRVSSSTHDAYQKALSDSENVRKRTSTSNSDFCEEPIKREKEESSFDCEELLLHDEFEPYLPIHEDEDEEEATCSQKEMETEYWKWKIKNEQLKSDLLEIQVQNARMEGEKLQFQLENERKRNYCTWCTGRSQDGVISRGVGLPRSLVDRRRLQSTIRLPKKTT